MPDELADPRLRAYYGAQLVHMTLDLAETLASEANRFVAQLKAHPEHFLGRWDRERVEMLAPSVDQLLRQTLGHHNERDISKFSVDLSGMVQKYRVIEPLSNEARIFLGLKEEPSPGGPVDSFRKTGQKCAQLREILFAPLFDQGTSFAESYFGSEFFSPLAYAVR